ncbi:MAG: prepilin-type N-terminal cleavage/methylation domain-containing protein [Planctomycetota bacterium]|jgi:prepilin-type N-terminal cleavage/methylation domain-containing protein
MKHHKQDGFTLIELLIVISIIATLAAVLLPRIMETGEAAKQTETEATMLQLYTACNTFNTKHGIYPPDDFRPLKKGGAVWKSDNRMNSGIESFLVMVSQSRKGGTDLSVLRDKMINTDADKHGAPYPLLDGMTERMEIADGWKTPLVYFTKINMKKTQMVKPSTEEAPVQVKAKKREDGTYYGAKRFQFLSAGKDLIFGTDDDIVWPSN